MPPPTLHLRLSPERHKRDSYIFSQEEAKRKPEIEELELSQKRNNANETIQHLFSTTAQEIPLMAQTKFLKPTTIHQWRERKTPQISKLAFTTSRKILSCQSSNNQSQ